MLTEPCTFMITNTRTTIRTRMVTNTTITGMPKTS